MRAAVLLLGLGLIGCDFFRPRSAQPPEPTGERGYRQPTTPTAVVENLRLALSHRDGVLFLSCLLDSSRAPGKVYRFEPSGQAQARYPELFTRWDRDAERRSFTAMMSRVPSGVVPELLLIAPEFLLQTPDSVLFQAGYQLYVPHQEPGIPQLARGTLRWTFVPLRDGTWAILRWSDTDPDTAAVSWSVLKALWAR